jgi:hypothetical protein
MCSLCDLQEDRNVQQGEVTCHTMSSDFPRRYQYTTVEMVYPVRVNAYMRWYEGDKGTYTTSSIICVYDSR